MGFFHLVQQDHAVGLAPNGLGEVAALVVADIARGRTNHSTDRVLFHELTHVDADQVVFAVKQKSCQSFAQLCFAHPRGAQKQERSGGSIGVTQARTRAANGIGHGGDALLLPDHPLVQALLHQQQLVTLALHQLGHRYAGGTGHHFGDFLGTHLRAQQARLTAVIGLFGLFGLRLFMPLFEFWQFAVLKLGDLVELALAGQFIDAKTHPVDFFLDECAALGIGFF